MSKQELNEQQAISRLVARKCSSGYQRAVEANVPVTYVSGTNVICEHNGQQTIIACVQKSTKFKKPKVYSLE